MMIFFNFLQTRIKSPCEGFVLNARPRSSPSAKPCPLGLRDGLHEIKKYHLVQYTLLFSTLFLFFTSCALFRPSASVDDLLLNFYADTPPAHTQAAVRLTEKARDEIRAGKRELATEHLQKALTIDPQCPFPYYFLALNAHYNGDYKKSNGFLEKAKQLFSPFSFWKAKSYQLAGQNFEKLGNEKMAQIQFQKAKEIDPNLW